MSIKDPSPIGYRPLSEIKEVSEESQFKTFKQQVELNGKKLTVTLFYPKTSKIDPSLAKGHMEVQIAKMLEVAKAAGMGSKEEPGLRKLTFEKAEGKERVFGEYQEGKTTVRKNVLDHLRSQRDENGIEAKEKEKIIDQIHTIKKTIRQLSLTLPATSERPSPSGSTPPIDTETPISKTQVPSSAGNEDEEDDEEILQGFKRGDPVFFSDSQDEEDDYQDDYDSRSEQRTRTLNGEVEIGDRPPSVKGKEKDTRRDEDFGFEKTSEISSSSGLRGIDSSSQTKRVQKNVSFEESAKEALSLQHELEQNKLDALEALLKNYSESLEKLDSASRDKTTTSRDIKEIRSILNEYSALLKSDTDQKNAAVFKNLESALANVNRQYNKVVDQRKELEATKGDPKEIEELKDQENKYLNEVHRLNQAAGNLSLTTSQLAKVKGQAMAYIAVVEKKMDLMERKYELEEKPSLGPWQRFQLSKINKELGKAPSNESLESFKQGLLSEMTVDKLSSPYSASKAKEENQYPKELEFGRSHLNVALSTPANWTNIYSAFSKLSRSGRLYTSSTVNESLNVGYQGGVPAGVRNKKGYRERAANLFKTTSYLFDEDPDSKIGRTVSFRGGQFPTPKAAKEALTEMLKENPEATNIHINALLTPMITLPVKGKPDRRLLAEHKASITTALNEMIKEAYEREDEDGQERLEKVRDQLVFTNFGVNEGAVGELKVLMRKMRLGWHTSIGLYTNQGAQKFNANLRQKFNALGIEKPIEGKTAFDKSDLQFLGNLGAIVQVGQEMEAIWARNDYADAKMGHNQFKMPALWKAMDALTGTICYTDCMSGKDRTGEVESAAKHYLDEAHMNMNDRKLELQKQYRAYTEELDKEEPPEDFPQLLGNWGAIRAARNNKWKNAETLLTNPMHTKEELEDLFHIFKSDPDELGPRYADLLELKVKDAKQALGLEDEKGVLLKDKGKFSQAARVFGQNTMGIPETVPLRDTNAHLFPDVTSETIYGKQVSPGLRPALPKEVRDRLAERQREAINRRISVLSGSLAITQVNTSLPGFKIKGGEPLSRFSSGFDRDYVYSQLLFGLDEKLDAEDVAKRFAEDTGLYELSDAEAEEFKFQIEDIHNGPKTYLEKLAAFLEVIKAVEEAKTATFSPKAKVKA
ncbi:hypothetical protein [Criblamydia sequanensis]|uniref:Uncharacterized protein n=1 Tax=Candidatus Criblamydia sequanensis CRIB-18 TaxID=1437425 RepID=A0A090D0L2_9BACT|nr:hypothetical protein [Criblamydia sequanensis]CDR33108.1 hypothetical protein CSEC_0269 [Criblamydia sequanensis CRIB-18]